MDHFFSPRTSPEALLLRASRAASASRRAALLASRLACRAARLFLRRAWVRVGVRARARARVRVRAGVGVGVRVRVGLLAPRLVLAPRVAEHAPVQAEGSEDEGDYVEEGADEHKGVDRRVARDIRTPEGAHLVRVGVGIEVRARARARAKARGPG